jgi:hypothetical protein
LIKADEWVTLFIYVKDGGLDMPGKKKQVTCLADLMEYEVDEFSDMLDEGLFDNFDDEDGDSDISKDWKRALKDLEELGYMEDDK